MEIKVTSKAASGKGAARVFDEHIRRGNAKLKPVADGLRRLVKKMVPHSREAVNPWGVPTFDFQGPFCLMMAGKNHVTFGFTRGASLSDPAGLLAEAVVDKNWVTSRQPSNIPRFNEKMKELFWAGSEK